MQAAESACCKVPNAAEAVGDTKYHTALQKFQVTTAEVVKHFKAAGPALAAMKEADTALFKGETYDCLDKIMTDLVRSLPNQTGERVRLTNNRELNDFAALQEDWGDRTISSYSLKLHRHEAIPPAKIVSLSRWACLIFRKLCSQRNED